MPRFAAEEVLEIIDRDKVTLLHGAPTMFHALSNHPRRDSYDASSVRLCCSRGSAMPVEGDARLRAAFGCLILEGYGLSETSPVASFNHVDRERKPGSIGTPADGVEMRSSIPRTTTSPPARSARS